jgi:uncharacterized hydrophobic protein (TIGR00271 family)
MLHLRVYGPPSVLTHLAETLEERGDVSHSVVAEGVRPGRAVLTADVIPGSTDAVLEFVGGHVPAHDVAIARLDEIGIAAPGRSSASLIWADVLGLAHRYARPVARYLAFMATAGVIAGFGVVQDNSILIVGAMAVSPDLLPIAGTCVGLVARRGALALRAFLTLALGLSVTCAAAIALSAFLDALDLLPSGFTVGESSLSGLTTVNSATIGVALAAGIAGMLALETRASSAVGVGISITTIPAAAYLGVAAGIGQAHRVPGALAVLGVNVAMLVLAGSLTLLVQRRVASWRRQGRNSAARVRGGNEPR